jgi:transcriptional regulator with XRE-family HTH domain
MEGVMGRDARPFGAQLKALREAAGFTQEELATIAGLSVHAVSALERGERRRPHLETVRALSAALDLIPRYATRSSLVGFHMEMSLAFLRVRSSPVRSFVIESIPAVPACEDRSHA